MKSERPTEEAAAEAAGKTVATGVMFECTVTDAGAGKKYGDCKHRKGRNARVTLTEVEADAAEKAGWVKREGIAKA